MRRKVNVSGNSPFPFPPPPQWLLLCLLHSVSGLRALSVSECISLLHSWVRNEPQVFDVAGGSVEGAWEVWGDVKFYHERHSVAELLRGQTAEVDVGWFQLHHVLAGTDWMELLWFKKITNKKYPSNILACNKHYLNVIEHHYKGPISVDCYYQ